MRERPELHMMAALWSFYDRREKLKEVECRFLLNYSPQ